MLAQLFNFLVVIRSSSISCDHRTLKLGVIKVDTSEITLWHRWLRFLFLFRLLLV